MDARRQKYTTPQSTVKGAQTQFRHDAAKFDWVVVEGKDYGPAILTTDKTSLVDDKHPSLKHYTPETLSDRADASPV